MLPFDFRLFAQLVYRSFFQSKGTNAPLTFMRAVNLSFGLVGYILFEINNLVFLWLDEIIHPSYRRITIGRPVFIVGNPRSGTTFLHRMLSMDRERFYGFKTWEMLFPAIIQKQLIGLIGGVDRFVGSPIRRLILKSEKRVLGEFVDMHPTGLLELEEDEILLLHCFSTLYLVFFFPFYHLLKKFAQFDQALDSKRKNLIMEFYRRCLLRQAFLRGPDKVFLSKNPMFSCKIQSLVQWFPDGRFVYTVRDPLEAIPSMISEGHATCVFAKPGQPPSDEFQENAYEIAKIFYRYPLIQADENKNLKLFVVNYHELIASPQKVILQLYENLGIKPSKEFCLYLEKEEQRAKQYKSKHRYALDQFSISRDRIVSDFRDIIDRFGFFEADPNGKSKG